MTNPNEKLPSLRVARFEDDLETNMLTSSVLADAEQRMRDARRGTPGSGLAGGGRSGGTSSPVERALGISDDEDDETIGIVLIPDEGERALSELSRLLRLHHSNVEALFRLCSRWAPRKPDAKAITETKESNGIMCAHCTKWMSAFTEELHVHTDVNGTLEHPMALGRWCYDFVRSNGRLPTKKECQRRDKGLQVRVTARAS